MKFKTSTFLLILITCFILFSILSIVLMRENKGIFFAKAVDIKVFNFGLASESFLELSFILEYLIEDDKKPKIVFLPYSSVDGFKSATDQNFYNGSTYDFEKYLPLFDVVKLYINDKMRLEYFQKLLITKYFSYFTHRSEFKATFKKYLEYGRVANNEIDFRF